MPQLWSRGHDGWLPTSIDDASTPPFKVAPTTSALIIRSNGGNGAHWLLMAAPNVLLNGTPLTTGVRMLRDRDEIVVDGAPPQYFSTEQLATIEPFSGATRPFVCARCQQPITVNQLVVRCPRPHCSAVHHQMPERLCWSRTEACAECEGPTQLSSDYGWTPACL